MKDDPDQRLLDAANARHEAAEAEQWRQQKAERVRLESAARTAHKLRQVSNLISSRPVLAWDDLCLASQNHLISDAAHVAANPQISASELHRLYQERLLAHGDTDNPDISGVPDHVEELVLRRLKELLSAPKQDTP